MLKVVKTKDIYWDGYKVTPLAALEDEWGGKAAIIKDNNCLLLLVDTGTGKGYSLTSWWPKEAIEAIPDRWYLRENMDRGQKRPLRDGLF